MGADYRLFKTENVFGGWRCLPCACLENYIVKLA